jgi:hypothetical protein
MGPLLLNPNPEDSLARPEIRLVELSCIVRNKNVALVEELKPPH